MIPCGKLLRVSVLVDGDYVFIEGERSSNGTISKDFTDVTDKGHSGWREGGLCGIRSTVINFEGLVTDGPIQKIAHQRTIGRFIVDVRFSDGISEWFGKFLVSSLSRNGTYNDAETITISFESAGPTSLITSITGLQVTQDGSFIRVTQDGSILEANVA